MSILPSNYPRRSLSIVLRLIPWALILVASVGIHYANRYQGVRVMLQEPFPHKLSSWHLFTASSAGLRPNAGVLPYDLNTPLFSDYASKYRFVWMPQDASATYNDDSVFEFPVGTILAKTFAFPIDGRTGKENSSKRAYSFTPPPAGLLSPTFGTPARPKPTFSSFPIPSPFASPTPQATHATSPTRFPMSTNANSATTTTMSCCPSAPKLAI